MPGGLGKGLDSLIPDYYDEDFDSNSAQSLEDMLKEAGVNYHLIGDGCKVGNIKDAITQGYMVAKDLA